jgi:subtilisin family serine protease
MKKLFAFALVVGLMFGGCQKDEITPELQIDPVAELQDSDIIPGQFIIVYKDLSSLKSNLVGKYDDNVATMRSFSEMIFAEQGISKEAIQIAYSGIVNGVAATLTDGELSQLKKDSRIAYIEPDRLITLDYTLEGEDLGLKAQTTPWGITRVGGAVNYTGTAKAWVIDTGIDLDHPDLNVNTSLSKTFVPRGKSADDDNGHGSHVAGTIAAKNNDIGVIGVAAGASVVAVKVLDRRGSGAYSTIIAGVDYVGTSGKAGDVANMSLGGGVSQTLDDAVLAASNKGIWFSLAAGNDGKDANNYSPARVNGTYIYTISAMDSADKFATFSNFGNPPIDWCAPGVSIYSCYKGGGYTTMSGTSMAAPHAAGVRLLGAPKVDGYVLNDKDSNPDPIIHR